MELYPEKIYHAIAYYRLSKDDGDKCESNSISNQRRLIQEYVSAHDDIVIVREAYDDGYTGTNYDRPGFRVVMNAIESGEADCVIVKDLSRLGREYIETGKYLEMIFPDKGVRFIAINDDVDSNGHRQGDDIIIPVKNLINESYCRDLSRKLRAQFRLQRRNGEFLGAFASYGYCKSAEDKHKLVIDDYAATVVRDIFSLKMQGYSQQAIAGCLNRANVLPPSAYKKQAGLRYQSGFQASSQPEWTAGTVRRILTNTLYIGELVQGKRGTPNYKVKKLRERREEDWVVVEHNHDPIISELTFQVVQKMLQRDTRTSPYAETVQPLAGVLFCPDCQRAMCRRVVTRSGKKFYYYVCSTHKHGGKCSSHSFSQKELEAAVLHAIQGQVQAVAEMDALAQQLTCNDLLAAKRKRLDLSIIQKDKEIEGDERYRTKLYEALADGLIDRDDYQKMREKYTARIEAAKAARHELEQQQSNMEIGSDRERAWMDHFLKYQNIMTLRRDVVVNLVDKVYVYEGRKLHIDFNFRDEVSETYDMLTAAKKEAV